MKIKNILILAIIHFAIISNGQVGVNTTRPLAAFHIDGANDNSLNNQPSATQLRNDIAITNEGKMGIGTIAPTAKLHIIGSTGVIAPVKAKDMPISNSSEELFLKETLRPVLIDANGVVITRNNFLSEEGSYSVDKDFSVPITPDFNTLFESINESTIVTFKFSTDFENSSEDGFTINAKVSYSIRRGFRVSRDWIFSGPRTGQVTLSGEGTNNLIFNIGGDILTFSYVDSQIIINRSNAEVSEKIFIYDGLKI